MTIHIGKLKNNIYCVKNFLVVFFVLLKMKFNFSVVAYSLEMNY